MLPKQIKIGLCDSVGVERLVLRVCPVRWADGTVNHDVRDVNAFRHQFARRTLRQSP